MDKFVIRGGNPLVGTVRISGAKNSALPCMAAAILTEDEVTLENIPQVRDIETERRLLTSMGAEVELGYGRAQHRTTISCRTLSDPEAKYEIVKTMRASSLVLGPLIARVGNGARSHARRMRHRRQADRSAYQGSGKDGRHHHSGTRIP